ncbi:MAG: PIN domain-containing protein [Verrucomicrobiae bacterium]|nr:PIN domain-containing protein [Verrucomicrobiae bacterium]
MEVLADINILLALADLRHVHNEKTESWFNGLEEGSKLLICRTAQMGLLRLLVNPAVMQGEALSLREAWAFYGNLIQDPCVFEAKEPAGLQAIWAGLCLDFGSSPKVVADAYLAAFAMAGGFKLVTLDKAFEQFSGLDLILL